MKKNHNTKSRDAKPNPANQCVICGISMPEGDQVCRGCSTSNAVRIDPTPYRLVLHWQGETFEVPSIDWLREAIQEKREREARP